MNNIIKLVNCIFQSVIDNFPNRLKKKMKTKNRNKNNKNKTKQNKRIKLFILRGTAHLSLIFEDFVYFLEK